MTLKDDAYFVYDLGNFQAVQNMILNRDVNAADDKGRSPLSFAVASGRDQIVDLLLRNGAKPTESLLFSATDNGMFKINAK